MKNKSLFSVLLISATTLMLNGCNNSNYPSPITCYFHPQSPHVHGSLENTTEYIVDFVNYPTDLAKYGLRGKVRNVKYEDPSGLAEIQMYFNREGNLDKHYEYILNGGTKIDFTYNQNGSLKYSKNAKNGYIHGPLAKFIYDDSGKAIESRTDNDLRINFSYHENGNLKSVTPTSKRKNLSGQERNYLLMECDINGNLSYMKYFEYRPIIHDRERGWSEKYFKHNSNGQCIECHGSIKIEGYRKQIDSISFTQNFTYNSKGDLSTWQYQEKLYPSQEEYSLNISFDYEYDEQGNWIKMIQSGKGLEYLYSENYIFPNEKGVSTYVTKRTISYFKEEKEEKNKTFEVKLPVWNTFIRSSAGITPHKEANKNSAQLMKEIGEMDDYYTLIWSDNNSASYPKYKLVPHKIYPVIEETEEWYKIYIDENNAGRLAGYVQKKHCKEIEPHVLGENKTIKPIGYDLCIASQTDYSLGEETVSLFFGRKISDCYVLPTSLSLPVYSSERFSENKPYELFDHPHTESGKALSLPDSLCYQDSRTVKLDKITTEQIEKWFNPIMKTPIRQYVLIYAFNRNFYSFTIDLENYPFALR